MSSLPNPVLDEKELELLNASPEECLQHAVQRGALLLDRATEGLSPGIAAVVQSIATGERIDVPVATRGGALESGELVAGQNRVRSGAAGQEHRDPSQLEDRVREMLAGHPQLSRMLGERVLTPDEAMEAAHAIDDILGRYLTGTRYAVP